MIAAGPAGPAGRDHRCPRRYRPWDECAEAALDDVIEAVTGGHVTAVKIVLTSVVLALAVYQVLLMAVGYGKVRPPFLSAASASAAHRTVGDTILVLVVVIGAACLA